VLYKCRIVVMGERRSKINRVLRDVFSCLQDCINETRRGFDYTVWYVNTAYLHATVEEDIYVHGMPGFLLRRGKRYKLLKSLYGLPQAGKN